MLNICYLAYRHVNANPCVSGHTAAFVRKKAGTVILAVVAKSRGGPCKNRAVVIAMPKEGISCTSISRVQAELLVNRECVKVSSEFCPTLPQSDYKRY